MFSPTTAASALPLPWSAKRGASSISPFMIWAIATLPSMALRSLKALAGTVSASIWIGATCRASIRVPSGMSRAAVSTVTVLGPDPVEAACAVSQRLATHAAPTASSSEMTIRIGPLRLNMTQISLIVSVLANSPGSA